VRPPIAAAASDRRRRGARAHPRLTGVDAQLGAPVLGGGCLQVRTGPLAGLQPIRRPRAARAPTGVPGGFRAAPPPTAPPPCCRAPATAATPSAVPFRGNQAAVVCLAGGMPDALRQSVAAEHNYAETAFASLPVRGAAAVWRRRAPPCCRCARRGVGAAAREGVRGGSRLGPGGRLGEQVAPGGGCTLGTGGRCPRAGASTLRALPPPLLARAQPGADASAGLAAFRSGDTFGLRWFTPEREVPLCGHATLATAHVLFHGG
jgi:hypothetical protein